MQSNVDVVWQDRSASVSYFSHVFSYLYAFFFRFKNTVEMPNYRCSVGGCNNDSRYLDEIVKRSHVKELKFHHFPKDESKRQL